MYFYKNFPRNIFQLGGGMLSGKYDFNQSDEEQPKGRFFSSSENDFYVKWRQV